MTSNVDIESCRTAHESDREWSVRRSFLLENVSKTDLNGSVISRNRLLCLANCFVNTRYYGCQYPDLVMGQLREMNLPNMEVDNSATVSGIGLLPRVAFVKASAVSLTRTGLDNVINFSTRPTHKYRLYHPFSHPN